MNSRAKYLRGLEREVTAFRKIVEDLTRENYELRKMLEQKPINSMSYAATNQRSNAV